MTSFIRSVNIYSCFDAPNNVLPINSTCLITHANLGSVKDFSAL